MSASSVPLRTVPQREPLQPAARAETDAPYRQLRETDA